MVESQPGKVAAFDPSIVLSGFAAESRDQLIFNENQLVLAKLQQPRATSATGVTRIGPDNFINYSSYLNSSGGFAYIDRSFHFLTTPGIPKTDVHRAKIGFNIQVTTDTLIFWSKDFVDTTKIFLQYSFDGNTWFEVGTVSWAQFFDDALELFPGETPPTGQYRYTGTFDGGVQTGRFWRIRGDAETTYISQSGSPPNITLTVDSTDNFPDDGTLFTGDGEETRSLTYTGKTSTTFTGVDDPFGTGVSRATDGLVDRFADNGSYELVIVGGVADLPTSGSATLFANGNPFGVCIPSDLSPNNFVSWTGKVVGQEKLTGVTLPRHAFDDINCLSSSAVVSFWQLLSQGTYNIAYVPYTLVFDSVIYSLVAVGNSITEIQVIPTTLPILQHWDSDGTQAVSVLVEATDPYYAAYDSNDDAYYIISFNDSIVGAPITPDDNFDADTGTGFDAEKWVESPTNNYFQHSTASGTLEFKSAGGPGQLSSNYSIPGDFIADIELVSVVKLNEEAYFAIEAKDDVSGNVHQSSVFKGTYIPGVSTISGTFSGSTMTFTDTVGDTAILQNFRVNPVGLDFNIPGGKVIYDFSYNALTTVYDVTVSGGVHGPLFPGIPYTMDSASCSISNLSTPSDGQGFTVEVVVNETSVTGALSSGIALQIERVGTNAYIRYDDALTPGVFDTLFVGNMPTSDMRIQLFGDPNGQAVNISADNYNFTGTLNFGTPVFTVTTVDKQGDLVQVPSVSDISGTAIAALDLIRDPSATYNSFLSPRVAIATNGKDVGSGGEIYIKINDKLYKYLKSSLPLLSTEDGSAASVTTTGEIPATGITAFSYNGYTQGGLSYIKFDSDLSGVFVRSIATTTLLEVPLKALLDVTDASHPFGWNVSDLNTLYFVDGTNDLKLYDLNETKAGFVNVTSNKQVLAAGTGETATITAQVLNVYGEPKTAKSMTFTVSAGDGAISPASGCSDGNGEDTSVYTVGDAVGTATITVSVSDISC